MIQNTCLRSKVRRSTSARAITTSLRRSVASREDRRRCCDPSRFGGRMSTEQCSRKVRPRSMGRIKEPTSRRLMGGDGSFIFSLVERTAASCICSL